MVFSHMSYKDIIVGKIILIRNNVCKITEITTSKPGKHGHIKNL